MLNLKLILTKLTKNSKKNSEINDIKKNIGENDNDICKLIQKDSIDDFISFIVNNKIDISSRIDLSIFETNSFLLKKGSTLIEYAAFYGSLNIFKYLYSKKAKISQSIWLYAIHGKNPIIINIIKKTNFPKEEIDYTAIYNESIKCHYKDVSMYLEKNYSHLLKFDYKRILKSYNFEYFTNNFFNEPDIFYLLCQYDYVPLVAFLLKTSHPNFQTKRKQNSLEIAARKGNIEVMKLLLSQNKINVNAKSIQKNSEGYIEQTPLLAAIFHENDEAVQLLLSNDKINVNSVQFNYVEEKKLTIKKSCLDMAVSNQNVSIVKLLLNHKKIDVNSCLTLEIDNTLKHSRPILFTAIEYGNKEIFQLLLNRNDINVNQFLINKLFSGHKMQYRIQHTVFNRAFEKDNIEIVKLILNSGKFDVNLESTSEKYEDDLFKENILMIFLGNLIVPYLNKLIDSNILKVLILIIITYIICISFIFLMKLSFIF